MRVPHLLWTQAATVVPWQEGTCTAYGMVGHRAATFRTHGRSIGAHPVRSGQRLRIPASRVDPANCPQPAVGLTASSDRQPERPSRTCGGGVGACPVADVTIS